MTESGTYRPQSRGDQVSSEYRYPALRVQQRETAPPFYLIGAPARDITQWAGAPHKKTSLRAGYQRELDENRLQSIEQFLELSSKNILPSAALIAVRPANFAVEGDDQHCEVVIHLEAPDDTSKWRMELLTEIEGRLSAEELASVAPVATPEAAESAEEDLDTADSVGESDDELDVSRPDSYMSSLYAELKEYDALDSTRKDEMDEFVRTMMRPGLIMDGQHRIFGAKDAHDGSIVLPLVLVPGLDVSEQVFNFYVLNNKAKPLDKRQLRSIIATSLTAGEIARLYERFSSSGLRADEAQWTYRVHTDPASPFAGLISLKLTDDEAPIDDNIMDQLVSRFIKMPRTYNPLKKGVPWDMGDPDYSRRLLLFYALWRAVKDQYPEAWEVAAKRRTGAQLFQKVSLLQTQEFVLDVLKQVVPFQQKSPLASPEDLYEATRVALNPVPELFYLKEWKRKGLDTGPNRLFFLDQMKKVVTADGKNLGNFALFRAE